MKTKNLHDPKPVPAIPSRKAYRRINNLFFMTGLILVGVLAILVGLGAFEEGSLLYLFFVHGGTALVPVGLCSILYDSLLRQTQMSEMKESVQEAIDNLDIPAQVAEVMPNRYTHIRSAGISDAYPQGDLAGFETELRALHHAEIRILGIYLENDARICNAIKEAVETRGCSAKIILWDPRETDALAKRAASLKSQSNTDMVDNIKRSLKSIVNTQKRMSPAHANNIEVKLHQSFIGVAMMGFPGAYHVGFYLRERLVSFGTHIKVIDATRYFYQELDLHFKSQWEDPTNVLFEASLLDKLYALQ
jgi:hypothetical protein